MSEVVAGAPPWSAHRRAGSAGELHGLDLLGAPTRSWWVFDVDAPAVVLGSAQRAVPAMDLVDVEIAQRRSGGGAVNLSPDGSVWIDVVLPRSDPLWLDDVSRSALWLGDVWVSALAACGVHGEVHHGPAQLGDMAAAACFAGVAPGEVVAGGRKLVGVSQRRTRGGARFQCVSYVAPPDTAVLVASLGANAPDGLASVLAERVGVVPVSAGSLVDAFGRAIVGSRHHRDVEPR